MIMSNNAPESPRHSHLPKTSGVPRLRKLHLEKMELFSIPVRITPGNGEKVGGCGALGESNFSIA